MPGCHFSSQSPHSLCSAPSGTSLPVQALPYSRVRSLQGEHSMWINGTHQCVMNSLLLLALLLTLSAAELAALRRLRLDSRGTSTSGPISGSGTRAQVALSTHDHSDAANCTHRLIHSTQAIDALRVLQVVHIQFCAVLTG